MKDVMIIFKTHLDIGFTDFGQVIVKKYIDNYIPKAIDLAYELKDSDTPFIWSVGSWIINEALKYDDGKLKNAIEDGLISWHALPFTSHTELMSVKLFNYGLDISKKLDERFGKRTIAAKMSDVPGHTVGMIPSLVDHGVELLHIGVNPATPVPECPRIFNWKCNNDTITVMYNGGGYGDFFEFDDFVVCFGFTGDNLGPQTAEDVKEFYDSVKRKYPDANVYAATLNDVAKKIRGMDLPVIEDEIGDTWIHGAGTDPKKICGYREILRKINGININDYDFNNSLLLVPEHTCGLDLKTYFHNDSQYFLEDFKQTKKHDDRLMMEKSWDEQREYVKKSAEILDLDFDEITKVEMPSLEGFEKINETLNDVEISYQLFDRRDYLRYSKAYMQINDDWAMWDFTKVGLPEYCGGIYPAETEAAWKKDDTYIYKLKFDSEICMRCGLPVIYVIKNGGNIEVRWFNKMANRLPEAFWVKFKGFDDNCLLNKMNLWIDPSKVIGSPLIHAIDSGIKNKSHEIISLDAALVAPFGRRLLDYDVDISKGDLYFNLYNNIWNTNFPMWYSDDSKFRFEIKEIERL